MRVSDLRHMCANRNLDTSGRKAALVQRLSQADDDNHANKAVVSDHRVRPNEDESASEGTDNENDVLSDNEGEVHLVDRAPNVRSIKTETTGIADRADSP